MQRGEPLPVEPLLDARNTLVVDVDEADLVRRNGAVRVDALVFGEEADAGNAEPVHFLLLLGRDLALEPDETTLRRQPVAHFLRVEIWQGGGEQFDRLVRIDQLARFGEQRGRFDVGRENLAVAVENVRPRGGDRVLPDRLPAEAALALPGKQNEFAGNHAIHGREQEHGEAKPRLRLHIAIHGAPVEERTEYALPAGLLMLHLSASPECCRSRRARGRGPTSGRSDRAMAPAAGRGAPAGCRANRTA